MACMTTQHQTTETDTENSSGLKRGIQKWDLVLMIVNSIIGAGIFGLPSKIYALTGVYSLLAFVVCAAIVLVFILCFAEVGSRFKETGGPYAYTLAAFGKFPAFLIGWLLLLSRIFNYATLINLFVTYLGFFLPAATDPVYRALIMVFITGIIAYVNHIGIKNTTRMSSALTIAKLLTLGTFIVVALLSFQPGYFTHQPFPGTASFSSAVLLLIFAFGGFESVMVNTGEIKEPQKSIPFGLLTATFIVACFYILIQLACIGTLPTIATSEKPLADAASGLAGNFGGAFIAAGAILSILGTLHVLLLSGSRLPFAFSEERQFPKIFSFLHPKYATPSLSILLVAALTILASIAWTFFTALAVAVIIRVLVYFSVCAALLKLRKKELQGSYYKLPYGNIFGIAGLLFSLILLSAAKLIELRNVGILLSLGILVYFFTKNAAKR